MREFPTSIYAGFAKAPRRPKYRRYNLLDVMRAERVLQETIKANEEALAHAVELAERRRTEKDKAA